MTARELDAARRELAEAVRVVELLAIDDDAAPGDATAIARGIIERDLARRRVEAWASVVARLELEAGQDVAPRCAFCAALAPFHFDDCPAAR